MRPDRGHNQQWLTGRFSNRLVRGALAILVTWFAFSQPALAWQQGGQENFDEFDAPRPAQPQANAVDLERMFDVYAFGASGLVATNKRLDAILEKRILRINQACALTATQRQKLVLAGRADIKRFFDGVESNRKRILDEIRAKPFDADLIHKEGRSIRATLKLDIFSDASMYHKVLLSTLDSDQLARMDAQEREARAGDYRTAIAWTMLMLSQNFGISDDQRCRLEDLLSKHTTEPKALGQQPQYAIIVQLSTLPEDMLKSVFDDLQWQGFRPYLATVKQIKPQLMQRGFIPGDDATRPESSARHHARPAPKETAPIPPRPVKDQ